MRAGLMEAKELTGRVMKLSNWEFSQHTRLLKIDKHALRYYKKVPSDFNSSKMASVGII